LAPLHQIDCGITKGASTVGGLHPIGFGFGGTFSAGGGAVGALALLSGETDGFAIDATSYDSVTAASYVGGRVGGTVAVIDTGTPANDRSNVPLDASNLVQSGTSPKMVHNASSPYVRWSAHNLALQSQTFDNAAWTSTGPAIAVTADDAVAPDGTTTADLFSHTGSANLRSTNSITVVSGGMYTVSFYANSNASDWVRVGYGDSTGGTNRVDAWFDVTNGTVGTTSAAGSGWSVVSSAIAAVGSGWYRCSLTCTTGATTSYVFLRCANADNSASVNGNSAWFWGVQVNRGYIATPYLVTTSTARIGIPLSYDAAAAQYGVLVEPAGTNLLVRSEAFDDAGWTKTGDTGVTANATTAPDGATTAEKFFDGSGTSQFTLRQGSLTVTAAAHSVSLYAKAAENEWIELLIASDAGYTNYVGKSFDLTNGVVGTTRSGGSYSLTSSSITNIGNGWYRCTITTTLTNNSTHKVEFNESGADDFGTGHAGDSASGLYVWGAQLELGSVATSYIPTLGSTVTRAVDNVNALVSTMPWSATEGTVYADYLPSVATGTQVVWHADDGTGDERIYQYRGTSDPLVSVIDGGVNQLAPLDLGTITGGARSQTTFAWKANDFAGSHGGAAIVADTGGTIPTMTTFRLGTDQGSSQLNGLIKRLVWVPRRVVDGDLPTWRYNF
jgi:hypothetical protein